MRMAATICSLALTLTLPALAQTKTSKKDSDVSDPAAKAELRKQKCTASEEAVQHGSQTECVPTLRKTTETSQTPDANTNPPPDNGAKDPKAPR